MAWYALKEYVNGALWVLPSAASLVALAVGFAMSQVIVPPASILDRLAFQGTADSGFYTKAIGSGTTVKSVLVDGDRGFWLTGDPHFLYYEGPTGDIYDPRRWVGNALLWPRDAITYRLETSLDQAGAIELAESMP